MEKIIIAAVAENGVIGKDGEMPWHYPEDLKHFREITMNHPVVMGKETYFSLPEDFRPLPGRNSIVLSFEPLDLEDGAVNVNSFEEAWKEAEKNGNGKVFIGGGASVYRQTLEEADRMILTRIHREYEGDTYFPDWEEENWREEERDVRDELSFVHYSRR